MSGIDHYEDEAKHWAAALNECSERKKVFFYAKHLFCVIVLSKAIIFFTLASRSFSDLFQPYMTRLVVTNYML